MMNYHFHGHDGCIKPIFINQFEFLIINLKYKLDSTANFGCVHFHCDHYRMYVNNLTITGVAYFYLHFLTNLMLFNYFDFQWKLTPSQPVHKVIKFCTKFLHLLTFWTWHSWDPKLHCSGTMHCNFMYHTLTCWAKPDQLCPWDIASLHLGENGCLSC